MTDARDGIATFQRGGWDKTDANEVRTPLLLDAGSSLMGYRESLQDSATRATDAIAEATLRFGVGAVVDSGSTFESIYRARAAHPELRIVAAGPTLTDEDPRSESERQITDRMALGRSLSAYSREETGVISVRTGDAAFVRSVRAQTHLPILVRTTRVVAAELSAVGNAALVGAHHVLGTTSHEGDTLSGIANLRDEEVIRRAEAVAQSGVAILTGMLALRRSILPREALETSHLEELVPVFPHARHLVEMRRFGGYLAGRQQLASKSGLREPSPAQRRIVERGWQVLRTAVSAFVEAGGTLLPASLSPGVGVVPGFALKEEATLLAHLLSTEWVLTAITTTAARFFGVSLGGELTARVDSIHDPDLILRLRRPEPRSLE